MRHRAQILNGAFDPVTFDEAVDTIFTTLDGPTRGWVCTVNVATLMAMRRDAALQSFVERALLVVPDGQPIVWCARLFGAWLPERVAGIDLIDALCRRAAAEHKRVYLLGSTPPLVARAVATLRDAPSRPDDRRRTWALPARGGERTCRRDPRARRRPAVCRDGDAAAGALH
jgi:N-acetylglucosaminyldiphosphoundecaprenol N-acetyl-beta-D-mannosaminyltransferase